ncbi:MULTISPECIES: anhydro-N-acetylmuramic acid kinase AnmK [unclassified Lactococcus]|uniref:anhydro-N-acetylmuramic acid kinase AnmK n=1 Tax=unclassified Lactococcus TaxID=2643510 RepID=UPI0011CAD307|nr:MULTISPECIES: anhydro-N-acetylmuramic acid kinase AnmK [unclassified Lactococcus]MQW23373.1 anhydro-N-acetylmuramic acid kinase [Lactococcus sp. dk101]TXK37926.1 anhydro-N-acetylmuramic acid kinase [Lactococcus sp. dk310]TXK49580.1 anhydro-N-acetylmuramic acid kinase [Lactococcus sp. dk322]
MVYAVGLMSGTSLDGIDAALVTIDNSKKSPQVKELAFLTLAYTEVEKEQIKACLSLEDSDVQKICSLNFSLGKKMAMAVKSVCQKVNFPLEKLDFIASHGQTIWHQPQKTDTLVSSTLQIGEAAVIAYETNCQVVSNFRVMDMAAGGQGAPLVPFSEGLLYHDPKNSRLLQNIGGIGNVTLIPKESSDLSFLAFDTGPGNMMIDEACQIFFNQAYDDSGKIAASGQVNLSLLTALLSHPFFNEEAPKTTGREMFGAQRVHQLVEQYPELKGEDVVATLTMFTAQTIANAYREFIFPKISIDQVIIGGGGSYNLTLLEMLRDLLPEIELLTQEDLGRSSESKEAVAFALLANESLHHRPSNIPFATGAKEAVILGTLTPAPFRK